MSRIETPMKFRTLMMLTTLLFAVGRAGASEQSEAIYSRGLINFHAGRYQDALAELEQAVAADADDVYARYYRGVTRARLNDYRGAADDLRAVAEANPQLEQATLELGVALVEGEEYRAALPWLERAQQVESLQPEASFFLGIAQLRLGQLDAARGNFERSANDPRLSLATSYYQGVVAYQSKDRSSAEAHFKQVVAAQPDSEMAREANRFLEAIANGSTIASSALYSVYAEVGFQYDSNVQLAPSDDSIKSDQGISDQADGRATILAGGTLTPWRSEHAQLSLGYEFFQSLHFDLDDFNLQDHRPVVQFSYDWAPVRMGVQGRYDFYLQQTHSFLQQAQVVPWFAIDEGEWTHSELIPRFRYRDFLDDPEDPVLDGFNYSVLARQYLHLGQADRYLYVGYRFDHEDPSDHDGEPFGYDGHEINTGIGFTLPAEIGLQAEYAFRHESYGDGSKGRDDDEHLVGFAISKALFEHFSVTLAYFGDFNRSNKGPFRYDRNVGSIAFGVRF